MTYDMRGPEGLMLVTQVVARTLEAADRGLLPPPPVGVVGTREDFLNTLDELAEEVAVGVRVLLENGELYPGDRGALQAWLDGYVNRDKETT